MLDKGPTLAKTPFSVAKLAYCEEEEFVPESHLFEEVGRPHTESIVELTL